jgi:hypothetical protein
LVNAACTWPWTLVFQSATGMLISVTLQPEHWSANSCLTTCTVAGLGRMSPAPITRVLALAPESLMIQSAAAFPATLNGAVTSAVTPAAQPSQSGGSGEESS